MKQSIKHCLGALRNTHQYYSQKLFRMRLGSQLPINPEWGFTRGKPIDRYYIEQFLTENGSEITGEVLSVGDDNYAHQFAESVITKSDVLHLNDEVNSTITGNLEYAPHISSNKFDCFLLIQTLQFIYDFDAAVETTARVLKPGGIVLATLPGITPLKHETWGDSSYWRFTPNSARRLFSNHFDDHDVSLTCYGNSLAANAFLHGLAVEDIGESSLQKYVDGFDVTLAIKARKRI